MKKLILAFLVLFASSSLLSAQDYKPDAAYYNVGFWTPDTLGNHRAVINVTEKSDFIVADIPWRRRDKTPEETGIIIIDATTGAQISNLHRVSISQEAGQIIFEPQTVPSKYYIYYLPYYTSGGPYPKITYVKEETTPDSKWLSEAKSQDVAKCPKARFEEFQSLSEFDSFYPMEVIATQAEKEQLIAENSTRPYILFPETRENGIRMFDNIPYRWAAKGATYTFLAEADLNEYFVFQLGLWACKQDVNNVEVEFSDLKGMGKVIPASSFTCFNTEGVDWLGKEMDIDIDVTKDRVQALWMGLDIPGSDLPKGVYQGTVTVKAEGMADQTVAISLNISDYYLADRGDNDIYKLSRLRWLNSQEAVDNSIVEPFTPMTTDGNTVGVLGRTVELDQYGLPAQISSYFTEEMTSVGTTPRNIITSPFRFIIQQGRKAVELQNKSFAFDEKEAGITTWSSKNSAGDFDVAITGQMEFDGFMEYHVTVKANKDTKVEDIRLEVPMYNDVAKYWLGLGEPGGERPKSGEWKWDQTMNQEGYWFGDVNAGLQCLFRDTNYVRPLNTNFYQQKPLNLPPSWYNEGKGGITYKVKKNELLTTTYSGAREIKEGEELNFIFLVSVTPFKSIDTQKQWHDRYYHTHVPIDTAVECGTNTINIHHAQTINPFINYPFLRPDYMKQYIDEAHEKGVKVKIYYTVRELANRAPELWALRSFGHEVFSAGDILGYSWLREHLGDDYIAAWFVDKYKDAAIVTSGVSRWHNYYVEGLEWLVKNVGVDGLYIDDIAIDRTTMKRVRKVLELGCPDPTIDLHSASQYNPSDGYINSAFLYMEHMPYLDRLWFGEYFKYEKAPDYWMTEVAGIPFGMMGEMLQGDGNPWRGMVYGMTARYRYHGKETPKYFWNVWDSFGIQESKMMGYWVSYNPVKTDNDNVLATSFVKDGEVMIALANWVDGDVEVNLKIDWEKLGIDKSKAKVYFPKMDVLQSEKTQSVDEPIKLSKEGGALIIIK